MIERRVANSAASQANFREPVTLSITMRIFSVSLLLLLLSGCEREGAPTRAEKAADPVGRAACLAHQMNETNCGTYRVLSYVAKEDEKGHDVSKFELERDDLKIRAYCAANNCYMWSSSVGKTLEADNMIQGLITFRLPECEDPRWVQDQIEGSPPFVKRPTTAEDVAKLCTQTLIVETKEAK